MADANPPANSASKPVDSTPVKSPTIDHWCLLALAIIKRAGTDDPWKQPLYNHLVSCSQCWFEIADVSDPSTKS